VERRHGFGVDVRFSYEEAEPLDTGGGLKRAAEHFRGEADFLLHNVDVLSDVDLRALWRRHLQEEALATLAVRPAASDRYLLVAEDGAYCGYGGTKSGDRTCGVPACAAPLRRADFCGIHVISPRIFDLMTETGVFSIIYVYSRLASAGERVRTTDIGEAWWMDIGTHESLETARRHFSDS
jgi:NDP-sugar pyrophosphorylase family protein